MHTVPERNSPLPLDDAFDCLVCHLPTALEMLLYPQPVPGCGYGAPPPAAQNDEEEDAPTMHEILFGYGESAAEWKSEHQAQFTFVGGMPPQLPPHLLPAQQFYPVPQQPSMPQQVPTALFSEEPAAPAAAPVPEAPPVA